LTYKVNGKIGLESFKRTFLPNLVVGHVCLKIILKIDADILGK